MRLFHCLCQNLGAEPAQLLLHTEVCWLSRGIVNRLLELGSEVHTLLSEHRLHATLLDDTDWLEKLSHLVNVQCECVSAGQGQQHSESVYKLGGFLKKAGL